MKAIYKNIALAALALGAVACSQEDDFSPSYLSDPDAVRITAQVGTDDVTGGFTRSNPIGTADEQKEFNTGDQIAVNGVTYEKGETSWNPVGDAYLKWQTNEMNVTAYYPVGKNNASATTFTVPTEYADLAALADADYMIYSGTQTKGDDKAINLTMTRKMVRIVVDEISFNDQFATGYSVTGIKVHANTTGYADGEPVEGNIEVSALQQDDDFYALLAPTTAADNATFLTVTVNDGTTSQALTVKGIPTTIVGHSYNYSLVVGKDYVSIGNVTVADWNTGEITGGEAEEVKVETTIEGTTATFNIPELATDAMVQAALTEALEINNATLLVINGIPTEAQQSAMATALSGKTGVALVMGGVTVPVTAITELTDIDLAYKNGTGENGHVVTADGYIVTSKAGLDAWRTAASSNAATNLTLACDIDYNSVWSYLNITYKGVIDGKGYAIKGLTCNGTDYGCFIKVLETSAVIKHLGMVGGSFSNSNSGLGAASAAFVWYNNGIIMGCYNSCSVTSAGSEDEYGGAAGIAFANKTSGIIIACYNTGTVSAGGHYGAGIAGRNENNYGRILGCYNTGAVSGKGASSGYMATAITSLNGANINDCYYTQPSLGYKNSSNYSPTATNITEWTSDDWTAPMNTMNAAIEAYNETATVKCNYRYAINTDASTKSTQPLVIVKVE